MSTVIVRVNSHRAWEKLKRVLGTDELEWFFSWEDGNNFVQIPENRLTEARAITGITKARPKGKLMKYLKL